MDAAHTLRRGRDSYERRAWAEAYDALVLADQAAPLDVDDLDRLATAAALIGRDDDFVAALERAHHALLGKGDRARAARCAFWSGLNLLFRGEAGRATGWLARARRVLEQLDCAEQGYLMLPDAELQLRQGDYEAAYGVAAEAAAVGARFGEPDLTAFARHVQGRALVRQGKVAAGLALLDEAMLAATTGELSPIMTGVIYCNVIDACQRAYALDRAREWTSALARWCERQPDLVAFTATCHVHRAEILRLSGAWPDAFDEARRACSRARPPAAGFYQQAELHRLRGDFAAAEEAYRQASQGGWEPQPGLSLLRLAQGRPDAAEAAIRRALDGTTDRLRRLRLLPAYVQIMLAVGDAEAARGACRELESLAAESGTEAMAAMAEQGRGALALVEGDPRSALGALREAARRWQQVEVPYEVARARELVALACRALDDDDGYRLELTAARTLFAQLGAEPDVVRVDSHAPRVAARPVALTARELQVLRLVATGKTNKAIAAELSLSRKTVDRHLSNIFTKLDVPSRTAATAYAYKHSLI